MHTVTPAEITRVWKVTDRTLRNWCRAGLIAPINPGRRPLRFDVLAVAELVAEHPRAGVKAA